MAAITGIPLELLFWRGGASPTVSNFTLNGSTDQAEYIFQAYEDITLTRLGFRQGTVTGTSPVYRISIQGVSNGVPDGTILGGGSPASTTFTPVAGGNSTWQWKTLDNSVAITRGTWYAVVIDYSSGTIDGSNNCSFGSTSSVGGNTGYAIQNDAGSRTKQATAAIMGYGSSSVAYGLPITSTSSTAFSSASSPDERANLINIPTTWCSTYKIVGVGFYGNLAAATTFDIVLYDTDGTTVLQTINFDTDTDQASTTARRRELLFDESALSTLSAGSSYRLAFKPAGTNLTSVGLTVAATADLDAHLGGAAICQASTRTDAGAWSNDNTTRFGINPILADITAPSGGGSAMLIGPGKLVRN